MATSGKKAMGSFKQRLQSSAGCSQDGGGGGATPPPSPRNQPRSSPPHDEESLLVLIQESTENSIIQQKFKILSQHYVLFRRVRIDGSCFYRAFLFSYLEKLQQMRDCQAEVTRLMECLEVSRENFCQLKWDKAYFLNPEAYFSSVVSDFKNLVKAAAYGLSTDELFKISLQEITSLRILSFLRLLTEIEIRTHEEDYKSLFPRQIKAHWCCMKAVRPMHIEATKLQMRALSYTLGIPLRLELVDQFLKEGVVQVQRVDFFPRSESRVSTASGSLDSVVSCYSSSTAEKPAKQGRDGDSVRLSIHGTLVSSCGMPWVTLLCRLGQCDILYHK